MITIPKTLPLTIRGETREVEVRQIWPEKLDADSVGLVGLYQKRPGGKLWRGHVRFYYCPEKGTWEAGRHGAFLNRAGYRLVGFADDVRCEKHLSQHNTIGQGT